MKKIVLIVLVLIVILIGSLLALPLIFHDKVAEVIKDQLEKNLNADIVFDSKDVDLSILSSFPDMRIAVNRFGLIGQSIFQGDTLFYADEVDLNVDLMSIVRGGEIKVNAIGLIKPVVNIITTEKDEANYNITKNQSNANNPETVFQINVQQWEITDGRFRYEDRGVPIKVILDGVNHSGAGDFTQDIFDIQTKSDIRSGSVLFDDIPYLSNKHTIIDLNMEMNLPEKKYTFRENTLNINKFDIGIDGFLQLDNEDIIMDMSFNGKEISIASLVSLIPGVYEQYTEGIQTSGEASFSGYAKGTLSETVSPDIYLESSIRDGKITYAEYPIPLEKINLSAKFNYPASGLVDAYFDMPVFNMMIDKQMVTSRLKISNFDNINWDVMAKGKINLDQLTHIIPIEDVTMAGIIEADVKSKGSMSHLKAKRFEKIPSQGNFKISDFVYNSEESPYKIGISTANATITPQALSIENIAGDIGKSDFKLEGTVSNYIGYLLDDSEILIGRAKLTAQYIDLNEWIPNENSAPGDSSESEPILIPKNLNLTMNSSIKKLQYSNLPIENLAGTIYVKEGTMTLEQGKFNLLEGGFKLSGKFSTIKNNPAMYDMNMNVDKLSIPAAFENFETIKKLVPIAENLTGEFSTDFKIEGTLDEQLNPIYEDISGKGLLEVAQATLQKTSLISTISSLTNLATKGSNAIALRDMIMSTEIRDGRIYFQPFDMVIDGKKYTIEGSNGLDGDISYKLQTVVPKGQVSNTVNSAISKITGSDTAGDFDVRLGLKLTGTITKPKIDIASSELVNSDGKSVTVKSAVSDAVKERANEEKEKVEKELQEKKEKAQAEAERKAKEAKEKAVEQAKKKAKEKLKGIFDN